MKSGFRIKRFAVSLGVCAFTFFGADVYLTHSLDAQIGKLARDDLFVRLSLIERDASAAPWTLDDCAGWDAMADAVAERVQGRVSVIRRDGVVLGDSELDGRALAEVENHMARPEVIDALAHARGTSTRWSSTLRQRVMYAAVPFVHDGATVGVVRIATPLGSVDEAIRRIHRTIFVGTAIALVLAATMLSLSAHALSRGLRLLTTGACKMAEGDLSVRTNLAGPDEVGALSRALDSLAARLSSAMSDLRSERDLLAGILDGMHEGVLLLDAKGRVLQVNPALRTMLSFSASPVGKPLIEAVRHADLKQQLDAARPAGKTTTFEIEAPGIKMRRLLVRATSLTGKGSAQLAVFVDVTDMRRLESLRRDFVANVSHELRTPVTAVRSAAETLREVGSNDTQTAARFIDIIERNAERLQRLIEDLLDLSRVEAKHFSLKLEDIETGSFVTHVLSLFQGRAQECGSRLAADVPATLPKLVADRRALEQVLTNLIDNALKYCPGRSVTVRARRDEGRIELSVVDDGPGIEPRHLLRLFERFYRVDAGRSREMGGTGLGLAIVKHLVEAMGGTARVESTVGVGSTFFVTLPCRND